MDCGTIRSRPGTLCIPLLSYEYRKQYAEYVGQCRREERRDDVQINAFQVRPYEGREQDLANPRPWVMYLIRLTDYMIQAHDELNVRGDNEVNHQINGLRLRLRCFHTVRPTASYKGLPLTRRRVVYATPGPRGKGQKGGKTSCWKALSSGNLVRLRARGIPRAGPRSAMT